jgi:hypothetical protein
VEGIRKTSKALNLDSSFKVRDLNPMLPTRSRKVNNSPATLVPGHSGILGGKLLYYAGLAVEINEICRK